MSISLLSYTPAGSVLQVVNWMDLEYDKSLLSLVYWLGDLKQPLSLRFNLSEPQFFICKMKTILPTS